MLSFLRKVFGKQAVRNDESVPETPPQIAQPEQCKAVPEETGPSVETDASKQGQTDREKEEIVNHEFIESLIRSKQWHSPRIQEIFRRQAEDLIIEAKKLSEQDEEIPKLEADILVHRESNTAKDELEARHLAKRILEITRSKEAFLRKCFELETLRRVAECPFPTTGWYPLRRGDYPSNLQQALPPVVKAMLSEAEKLDKLEFAESLLSGECIHSTKWKREAKYVSFAHSGEAFEEVERRIVRALGDFWLVTLLSFPKLKKTGQKRSVRPSEVRRGLLKGGYGRIFSEWAPPNMLVEEDETVQDGFEPAKAVRCTNSLSQFNNEELEAISNETDKALTA